MEQGLNARRQARVVKKDPARTPWTRKAVKAARKLALKRSAHNSSNRGVAGGRKTDIVEAAGFLQGCRLLLVVVVAVVPERFANTTAR